MEITIRHLEADDTAAVHAMFISSHVVRGSMRLPLQSLQTTEKRLAPTEGVFKLVAVCGDEVVGYSELVTWPDNPRRRHAGEVNMIVTAGDWQRKGVGRALMRAMIDLADSWLRLTRLSLVVWTTNVQAIRLYESLGFAIEGTMPAYTFGDDGYIDAHVMGRVKL